MSTTWDYWYWKNAVYAAFFEANENGARWRVRRVPTPPDRMRPGYSTHMWRVERVA